jgi:hypothetical protein
MNDGLTMDKVCGAFQWFNEDLKQNVTNESASQGAKWNQKILELRSYLVSVLVV